MLKKRRVKVIGNVEHHGNIPEPQGHLLWLVDKCPFWAAIIVLFAFIAIEMMGFACLYSIISSSSFSESLNYSLFSALGETVAESTHNSLLINRIISFQSILTNVIISFFMAIVLYKLININLILVIMEDHVVFDPTSGTLRLRIVNSSKFDISNARINATFRIYMPNSGRHANAKLKLKIDNINILRPYIAWNIATKPFLPTCKNDAQLDIDRYDVDRIYEFVPDLLNEKYRTHDSEEDKCLDYRNLDVTITVKSPLFGTDWVYQKSFTAADFVCGKIISLYPHGSERTADWSHWGQYDDMSESYCKECVFSEHCSIIKKSQRRATIN